MEVKQRKEKKHKSKEHTHDFGWYVKLDDEPYNHRKLCRHTTSWRETGYRCYYHHHYPDRRVIGHGRIGISFRSC